VSSTNIAMIGLAISILTLCFIIIDRAKKKNPELIDRAMKMVEQADRQAGEWKIQLAEANTTIENLNHQLLQANNKITSLNRELSSARDEVAFLQTQVNIMTRRVQKENNREKD
jgi:chromosome segregation ATPase